MKKTKQILLVLFVALLAMPMLNSCKKGENDPMISLKSRDGRLVSGWKLVSIEGTEQFQMGATTVILTYSFDGTIYTVSGGGESNSSTGTYEMTIDKGGVLSIKETLTFGGTTDVYTGTGTWQWLQSSKNKDHLWIDGANIFPGNLYYVDRLSSKELVLKVSSEENDNGDIFKNEFTFTFEKL